MLIIFSHISIAIILFFLVNWLGKKSTIVGYAEFSTFTDKLESPLFNLVFRIVAPLVYIVIISALLYSLRFDAFVKDIYLVIVYYFIFRWIILFLLNRNYLTNWWRQLLIGSLTSWFSYVLYKEIIVEKKNILPEPGELANELWIIIILFLYNIINKLSIGSTAQYNSQNNFIEKRYSKFSKEYGPVIDSIMTNDRLKSLAYAILIYEDFSRPKIVRLIENISFRLRRKRHSLGVMQFQTNTFITDKQSVQLGVQKIQNKYDDLRRTIPVEDQSEWGIKEAIIRDYNGGENYLWQVNSIEENLGVLKFSNSQHEFLITP